MTDAISDPAIPNTKSGSYRTSWLLAPMTFVVFLLLWEAMIKLGRVPIYIVPAPSDVLQVFWRDITTGIILIHFKPTLIEVLSGFFFAACAGMLFGTAISLVPIFRATIYPLLLALQTVPKVAVAPLFLIWFGFGVQSKIITVALISFFPILVNVVAGLSTIDHRRILLMRALNAGPFKTYLKVRLPSMLPFLFAGLEVAIILAITGAIVAEFIGASVGLGALIIQRQAAIDVAGVFSVLFFLSLMGLALHWALHAVGHQFTAWSRSEIAAGL